MTQYILPWYQDERFWFGFLAGGVIAVVVLAIIGVNLE